MNQPSPPLEGLLISLPCMDSVHGLFRLWMANPGTSQCLWVEESGCGPGGNFAWLCEPAWSMEFHGLML